MTPRKKPNLKRLQIKNKTPSPWLAWPNIKLRWTLNLMVGRRTPNLDHSNNHNKLCSLLCRIIKMPWDSAVCLQTTKKWQTPDLAAPNLDQFFLVVLCQDLILTISRWGVVIKISYNNNSISSNCKRSIKIISRWASKWRVSWEHQPSFRTE